MEIFINGRAVEIPGNVVTYDFLVTQARSQLPPIPRVECFHANGMPAGELPAGSALVPQDNDFFYVRLA